MSLQAVSVGKPAVSAARYRTLLVWLVACAAVWTVRLAKPDLLPWWNTSLRRLWSFSSEPPGTTRLGFETLSGYSYHFVRRPTIPKSFSGRVPGLTDTVPPGVSALSGKTISVLGYMQPLDMDKGKTGRFMLVNAPNCCFGGPVLPNHWIDVTMRGDRKVDFANMVPVRVVGRLEVGATFEKGRFASVYRMSADDAWAEEGGGS